MRNILIVLIILLYQISFSQSDAGKKYAEQELKLALSKSAQHNVINNKDLIIQNSETAIKIAETILFEIYGRENIESQKPYDVYLIKDYWVISGNLPEGYLGGTFMIIINAKNSEVIKITHGK